MITGNALFYVFVLDPTAIFINISRLWLTQEYMYAQTPDISLFELFFAHQLTGLLVLTFGLYYLQLQTAYLMQMFAFIPIIWFAYRYNWIGALLTIIVCNTLILVQVYQGSSNELVLYQPYIISYSLVGFLVGGVMLEHAKTMRSISFVGEQLLIKRDELLQST